MLAFAPTPRLKQLLPASSASAVVDKLGLLLTTANQLQVLSICSQHAVTAQSQMQPKNPNLWTHVMFMKFFLSTRSEPLWKRCVWTIIDTDPRGNDHKWWSCLPRSNLHCRGWRRCWCCWLSWQSHCEISLCGKNHFPGCMSSWFAINLLSQSPWKQQ